MKSLAAFSLLIMSVLGGQVFAEDATPQPLTRADCEKTPGWSWSERSNVCDTAKDVAQGPKPQPLTRADCDAAGMAWNERALACEEKSTSTARAAEVKGTSPAASSILINIDKSAQRMTVFLDGVEKFDWPVSTGRRGYSTPSGTFTPTSMNEIWYSKQWDNAPMPHAIFYMKDGHAIHGTYEENHLGKAASHGCVRIARANATILYQLVKATGLENTQVVLSGETPGGEGKVVSSTKNRGNLASSAKSRNRFEPNAVGRFEPGVSGFADYEGQPKRHGGFFRRLFGGR